MVQAPTLYPEPREVQGPPGKGLHGYYRKPNGWISVAPTTPSNRSDYEYKGFIFLQAYGQFANGTFGGAAKEHDARGRPWNPADEPWRLFFQKGGAKEFPVDQIIAYHWHLNPPYREVVFPQLKDVKITNIYCPECDKHVSCSTSTSEATMMIKAHLTSGIDARHKYTVADLKELGSEWGIDFETARTWRRKQTDGGASREARDSDRASGSSSGEVRGHPVGKGPGRKATALPVRSGIPMDSGEEVGGGAVQ